MLIIAAIVLLLVLPGPWNLIAFVVIFPIWILELFGWSRTVKHRQQTVGAQTLIGRDAVAISPCLPEGQVRLDGEIWSARCEAGVTTGDEVRVIGRDGLLLIVERAG